MDARHAPLWPLLPLEQEQGNEQGSGERETVTPVRDLLGDDYDIGGEDSNKISKEVSTGGDDIHHSSDENPFSASPFGFGGDADGFGFVLPPSTPPQVQPPHLMTAERRDMEGNRELPHTAAASPATTIIDLFATSEQAHKQPAQEEAEEEEEDGPMHGTDILANDAERNSTSLSPRTSTSLSSSSPSSSSLRTGTTAPEGDEVDELFAVCAKAQRRVQQSLSSMTPQVTADMALWKVDGKTLNAARSMARLERAVVTRHHEMQQTEARLIQMLKRLQADTSVVEQAARIEDPISCNRPLPSLSSFSSSDIRVIVMCQQRWRASRPQRVDPRQQSEWNLFQIARIYNASSASAISRYRLEAVKELLRTETSYLKNMTLLIKHFFEPFERCVQRGSGIVTPELVRSIFGNLRVIVNYNRVLLKDMRVEVRKYPFEPAFLGKILNEVAPFFKEYANYVNNYPTALQSLQKARESRPIRTFLRRAEEDERMQKLDVSDLLIMPVQRIPRYVLLVEDIVKHTPTDHVDYANLVEALSRMREVAAHVNDRQRQVEQLQKVYQVQTSIVECPSLLEPHRRFVKEGRVSTLGEDRVRSRTLFLFNDAVVFAKDLPRWESVVETIEASSAGVRQKHHYFYDGHIKLQHAVVEDTPQLPLGFALRSSARADRPPLILLAESVEEKANWMKEITNAIASSASALANAEAMRESPGSAKRGRKAIDKSGYLAVQEGGFVRRWQKRWITVGSGQLMLHRSAHDNTPRKSLPLSRFYLKGISRPTSANADAPVLLHIQSLAEGGPEVVFGVPAEEDLKEWIAALRLYTARNPLSKAASTAKKEEAKAPPSQQVKEIAQTDKDPNEEFMSFGGLFSTEKSSVSSQAPVQPKTASPSTKEQPQRKEPQRQPQGTAVSQQFQKVDPTSELESTSSDWMGSAVTNVKGIASSFASSLEASFTPSEEEQRRQEEEKNKEFRVKFRLPPSETALEYFTMASGGYVYVSQRFVCIDSIIKGEVITIPLHEIAELHKLASGWINKGTEAQIKLVDGRVFGLSGMLKRRECIAFIVAQAVKQRHRIRVLREGVEEKA